MSVLLVGVALGRDGRVRVYPCMGVVVLRRVDDSYDDVRGVAWRRMAHA